MNKIKKKSSKLSRTNIISVSAVTVVIILIGGIVLNCFSPVNSDGLVFAPSTNILLKEVKASQDDYHYQTTKGGKSFPSVAGTSPSIQVSQGNLVQVHLINEEKNQHDSPSRHNLNIDEFNVHTKDLSYFQSESVIFLADKLGTFEYYSSIHPNMKGTITVTE